MTSTEANDDTKAVEEKENGENETSQHVPNSKKKKLPAATPKKQNSDDDLGILDPDLEAYIGGDTGIGLELAEATKPETSDEEEEEEEEDDEEEEEEEEDTSMTPLSEEFKSESEDDHHEITQEQLDAAANAEKNKEGRFRSGVKGERDAYRNLCKELGITPIRRFMESLRQQVMDFSHYRLNSKDIIAMCNVLEDNHYVTWLSFEGNPAGDEGGEAIARLLESNYCITYLNIAGTEIAGVLAIIFWALAKNINLEVMDVSKNNLEDEDMFCISDFLATSVTLRELDLSRNLIGDDGLKALAEGLKTNAALEILDLSWNKIRGNKRAMPFFAAAAELKPLRVLNLGHNYLLDKAARGISKILSTGQNIEEIDVSLGRFNDASGPIIARGVKKSQNLKHLNLELQNWRQKDVAGIVAATTNPESKMESINFGYVFDVYKEYLKAESRALRFHPDLKIRRGNHFGLYKAKGPNPKHLVIYRADVVCKNFGTPLRMLIDELRTEEKILTQKQFKKFIKSCNLYKDKVMTESLMRNFAHGLDVNCEAIIKAYDETFPVSTDSNDPLQLFLSSKTTSKAEAKVDDGSKDNRKSIAGLKKE